MTEENTNKEAQGGENEATTPAPETQPDSINPSADEAGPPETTAPVEEIPVQEAATEIKEDLLVPAGVEAVPPTDLSSEAPAKEETSPTPAPSSPAPAQPSFTEVPEDKPATPAKEDLFSEVPHPPTGGGTKEDDFNTRFKAKLKELRGVANQKRLEQAEKNIEKIMAFALEHNRINNKDARKITGLKDERAREYLDRLEKAGKLVQMGKKGPEVFYMPTK